MAVRSNGFLESSRDEEKGELCSGALHWLTMALDYNAGYCWLVSGWLLWDDASGCWWIFCVVVGASHFVSGAVGLNWKKIEFTRTQLLERECSGAAIKYQTQLLFRLFYETQEQTLWLHFAGTYFNLSGCNGAQDTASLGRANGDNNLQNGLQSHRINCKMINTVIVLRANSKFIFAPFYFALHPLMR